MELDEEYGRPTLITASHLESVVGKREMVVSFFIS